MSFAAFGTTGNDNSLISTLGPLLNDTSTSDFKIIGPSHDFHVHKFVLSTRSQYFKELFSNKQFIENEAGNNFIDLSTEDLNPSLDPSLYPFEGHRALYAFLQALYRQVPG